MYVDKIKKSLDLGSSLSNHANFILEILLMTVSVTQSAFACSKLTVETLEQDVNYVQS